DLAGRAIEMDQDARLCLAEMFSFAVFRRGRLQFGQAKVVAQAESEESERSRLQHIAACPAAAELLRGAKDSKHAARSFQEGLQIEDFRLQIETQAIAGFSFLPQS